MPGGPDPQCPLDMSLLPDRPQDLGSNGERKIPVPIESGLSSRFTSLIDAWTSVVPSHIVYLVTAILNVKKFSQTRQVWNITHRRNKLNHMLCWWRYKNSDIVYNAFLLSLTTAMQLYATVSLHQWRHSVTAVVFGWMTEDITLILKYCCMGSCSICKDKYHIICTSQPLTLNQIL